MQKPLFSAAIDQAYKFEQVHLKQREIISEHIGHADSLALQRWLNGLTQDLLKTTRLSSKLHFRCPPLVPTTRSCTGRWHHSTNVRSPCTARCPTMSSVGSPGWRRAITETPKRMDTLRSGFEGTISIIRARVDLMLQSQNLTLLISVDKTTKSQAILQYTVEGLSVIVIAYYLSGLYGRISSRVFMRWGGCAMRILPPHCSFRSRSVSHWGLRSLAENFSTRNSPASLHACSIRETSGLKGAPLSGRMLVVAHPYRSQPNC